jgi:hypothetical protein
VPSVAEIRSAGTDLVVRAVPLLEPLEGPAPFVNHLRRFGGHYDLGTGSHLYRFLVALCGDAGAGSLKKQLLSARLQQMLDATHFLDLDRLYGGPLQLPRLSNELYGLDDQGDAINPETNALTQEQWQQIHIKDSQYRARCLLWMRAILNGPTPTGIALAAEAASGVQCDVFERYKWLDNASPDVAIPVDMQDIGETFSWNEFVVIPRAPDITEAEKRRILRLIDLLRPSNTVPTIFVGTATRSQKPVRAVAASSNGFTVKRIVEGKKDVTWPPVDPEEGMWITSDPTEAPTFAFLNRQESITFLTITEVTSSSQHIGEFNKAQRDLFAHLRDRSSPPVDYLDEYSYAKSFAPIQISIPWVANRNG